jgi:glycerol kinase
MGTGAFLSCPLGQWPVIVPGLLTSIVHEQGGVSEYVLEGTVNGAGSAIDWVKGVHKIEGIWKLLPGWLEKVKEPPLFLNGISGVGSPYWIPDLEPEFIGKGGVPEMVVAVVESIVFLLYRNFVEMKNYIAEPEMIQVSGGLAALDGICQLLADLFRISVYRPIETEATARGTCYLLAGKPDHWPESAPGIWFDPRERSLLVKRYHRWLVEMEGSMRSEG